jgi:hypothetical protein
MSAEVWEQPDGEDWRDDAEVFDPDTSPDWAERAWLARLSPEEQDEQALPAWTAEGEVWAAGFVHHLPGAVGVGFAAGGALDRLPPGRVLAGFADDAQQDGGLGELEDSELVGVLCAWRRLASWAAAGEAAAVVTLARRRAVQARQQRNGHLVEHVSDELAAALTLTGRSGGRLLELAAGLARLTATWAALAEGRIDWSRAAVVVDELAALADADALAVEARVLPCAGEMTTSQLRAALRRAVLAVDPAAAGRRRRAARKDARVEVWQEPSGNATLAGRELPPAEVIAADQRITALARWLQASGATGTMDQLRAAVFTALLAGRPVHTLLPETAFPGPAFPASAFPQAAFPGPSAAGDAASGSGSEASGCARPGGSEPCGCARPGDPGSGTHGRVRPGRHAGQTGSGWPPGVSDSAAESWPAGLGGSVNLTMPLASWLGTSDVPGEVPGYGPADADTCRDLAARLAATSRTRWCLTLTDKNGRAVGHTCARRGPGPPGPLAGLPGAEPARWLASLRMAILESGACSHARGSPHYRPPRSLRHLIEIRNRTCGFPGCRRPAYRCDLDHTLPFDQGGRTCECNLAALCRRHHEAKQAPGWHLGQPEPGTLAWTLPHGRSYTASPEPYPV